MSTSKKPARAKSRATVSPVTYVHETSSHNGDHRIVQIHSGTSVAGEWARNNQIAKFDALRACTDQYAGLFPVGVFRVVSVPNVAL